MPGGTQPTGAGHQGRPAGQAGNSLRTLGCGAQTVSSAVLSLRALAAGVDHLARRDLGPKRPRTPARAKTGARVPCDRRVAFRPFPTPRGLRSVGGGGFEGIGVETVVGVEARCGTVAPARRRLRGYSVACQAHGHRGPTAQGLLSQSPYRCRGRAVEAGSSEADVVCRDGISAPAGQGGGSPWPAGDPARPADPGDGCRAPPDQSERPPPRPSPSRYPRSRRRRLQNATHEASGRGGKRRGDGTGPAPLSRRAPGCGNASLLSPSGPDGRPPQPRARRRSTAELPLRASQPSVLRLSSTVLAGRPPRPRARRRSPAGPPVHDGQPRARSPSPAGPPGHSRVPRAQSLGPAGPSSPHTRARGPEPKSRRSTWSPPQPPRPEHKSRRAGWSTTATNAPGTQDPPGRLVDPPGPRFEAESRLHG